MAGKIEQNFEKGLFASRWLMAPMYLGLVVALAMLVFVFVHELLLYLPMLPSMGADKVILVVLTLIDLTLAGNLLLIVLFSGYESFVSKMDVAAAEERLGWMGTVNFSGLKMKLIASIVAISAIHLLKRFMELGKGKELAQDELYWLVVIHMVFVVSGVLMALMDWLTAQAKK
ncbi:TIGR00645 family protein [Shimia sp. CNT1-13L.2]|nr:TIGR00645 family protein [Shimia sp. CNT1-13L.2]MCP9483814.1 TIGR00645 family protein [Shimia sp. CNT1-13L.2]